MEISCSFNHADAQLIEKYAAEQNMSVPDFIKRAVMKALAEEKERAERNAAILAMEKRNRTWRGQGRLLTESSRRERLASGLTTSKKKQGKRTRERNAFSTMPKRNGSSRPPEMWLAGFGKPPSTR